MKLRRKYRLLHVIRQCLPNTTKRLYLDYNCGIHKACRSGKEHYGDQSLMIANCLELIDRLIVQVKPSELVFISIDGSVPMGKCKQQRYRRFKSVHEKMAIERIKRRLGIPSAEAELHVDYNMISPATNFMIALSEQLKIKIDEWKHRYPFLCFILSDSLVPGEGEHKIIDHLRSQPVTNDDQIVIYGLDADLIFLSLGLHLENIYLIRENVNQESFEDENYRLVVPEYIFLFIGALRANIIQLVVQPENLIKLSSEDENNISTTSEIQNYCANSIITDYIFLNFFLGNDFVSRMYFLHIKHRGCEILLQVYRLCLRQSSGYLVSARQNELVINNNFLQLLMAQLIECENAYWINPPRVYSAVSRGGSELEQELQKYQLVDKMRQDLQLKLTDDNFRAKYYYRLFSISPHHSFEDNVRLICRKYWSTMKWTLHYYTHCCVDWDWYYPFEYAPLMTDLRQHAEALLEHPFVPNSPADVYHQLMVISPPSSYHLLPKMFERILHNRQFAKYFPSHCDHHCYGRTFLWECPPKMPILDFRKTQEIYQYILNHLDEDEKRHNRIGEIYIK